MNSSLSSIYGPIQQAIPKIGEHSKIKCFFGFHWLSFVRQSSTNKIVGIRCGNCFKDIKIHDYLGG